MTAVPFRDSLPEKTESSNIPKPRNNQQPPDMVTACNGRWTQIWYINLSLPRLPLRYNEKENEFGIYINDTGLLMPLFGFSTGLAVLNDTLRGFAKGGIYENFVAETLIKTGYTLRCYGTGDDSVLEFVIEKTERGSRWK